MEENFDFESAVCKFSPPPTKFQVLVWKELCKIPKGSVTTYGRISKSLGINSAQAVGQAIAKNPFIPIVPCHRVVNANGSIGGYCGSTDEKFVSRKRKLLESEGVEFQADQVLASFASQSVLE